MQTLPSQISQLFGSIGNLTKEAEDAVARKLQYKEIKKKSLLLREGEICRYIYFVEKGIARSFYIDNDKEVTSWFMRENDIIISVKSFYLQVPAEESMQAIEDMSVYYISFTDLMYLYETHISFHYVGRKLTEYYYIMSEDRLQNVRKREAFDRYQFLLKNHPEIIQRVSSRMIASYLGINEETLSRVRSKR